MKKGVGKLAGVRVGACCLAVCLMSGALAQAQSLVVSKCIDKTGTNLGKRISVILKSEFRRQGKQLVDFGAYLKAARKRGLAAKLNKPSGVKTLAQAMDLAGVVTCFVHQSKGRYRAVVRLFDRQGVEQHKKVFLNKKPRLAKRILIRLASRLVASLEVPPELSKTAKVSSPPASADSDDPLSIALVPLVSETKPTKSNEPPKKPTETAAPTKADKDQKRELTAQEKEWAALLPKKDGGQIDPNKPDSGEDLSRFYPEDKVDSLETKPSARRTKPIETSQPVALPTRPKRKTKVGSMSNVLMVAGASMYTRAGLSPRIETDFYPGMHFFGRFLLNTLTDLVFLKDVGISALYEQSFGLKYTSELADDHLHATQRHVRLELLYRLSFEKWKMAPAFLFRLGYGDLKHTIESSYSDVLSARYKYYSTAVQGNLWLVRPWLGFFLGLGYLVDVKPAGDLAGKGKGITFSAGFFIELLDVVHFNLGYEQHQFLLDERTLGDTSDRFQVLFLRFGLSYH